MAPGTKYTYIDGEFYPQSEAFIPVTDAGFKYGYSIMDALRTFNGDVTFLPAYLDRIWKSAKMAGIDVPISRSEFGQAITDVATKNYKSLNDNGDLLITIYLSGIAPGRPSTSQSLVIEANPIEFSSFAVRFLDGLSIETSFLRHVSPSALSPRIKSTSRLQFMLAERHTNRTDPAADTLLLDETGSVAELTNSNIFIVSGDELITPPAMYILEGVTRSKTIELTKKRLDLQVKEEPIQLDDVIHADEVFITRSSQTIVPVTSVNGIEIANGIPGTVTSDISNQFSSEVGIDVIRQFLLHLPENNQPERMQMGGDAIKD